MSCTSCLDWSEVAAWLEISLSLVTTSHNLQSNLWKLLAVIWDGQWLFRGFLMSGFAGVQGVSLSCYHSGVLLKELLSQFL